MHCPHVSLQFVLQLKLLITLPAGEIKVRIVDQPSVVIKSRRGFERLLAHLALIASQGRVFRLDVLLQCTVVAEGVAAQEAYKWPCHNFRSVLLVVQISSLALFYSNRRCVLNLRSVSFNLILVRVPRHMIDEERAIVNSAAHLTLKDAVGMAAPQVLIQLTV